MRTRLTRRAAWALLALVLAVWVAPAGFAEAGAEAPAVTPGTRTTVTWMKSGSPSGIESRRDLLFKAFPALGDKYALEAVIAGKSASDVNQKLRLSLAAGAEIADLVMLQYPVMKEFILSGVLEDVSDVYKPVMSDVPQAVKDVVSLDRKQYGFVIQIKSKVWFYRKDMFDAAGIDPEKVLTTDDFIAAGKKLQAKYPGSYIWNLGPNFGTAAHYNFDMMLSGNGGQLWDEKKQMYVVDTDPGVRIAFEDLKKIYASGITAPIDDWTPDWERGFAEGKIASTPIAVWFMDNAYLPKWAPEQAGKWAATTWPRIGNARGGSQGGAGVTVIPSKAKNIAGAKEIMKFLFLTKEGILAHYKAVPTSFPTLTSAMNDPSVVAPHPYFGESLVPAIKKSLATFKLSPTTPATDLEFQIMCQALQKYVLGSQPLNDVLAEARKNLESQIGNPWKLF
jgi:ABC-type glycerol-3-phosphate transport system substrate-binding protein